MYTHEAVVELEAEYVGEEEEDLVLGIVDGGRSNIAVDPANLG